MSRLTITDHVGSLLRIVLIALCMRSSGSIFGWPRLAGAFGLVAAEAFSWLIRLVQPPGRRLKLSRGMCHVLVEGPTAKGSSDLPPVMLVHGFAGSHMYFNALANSLRAAGRTVIRHDNYGRGFSSSGAGPFTADLFVDQVREVQDELGLKQVDLVGYSMGGAISIAFAAAHPERLRSLSLLAPAGMPSCDGIPALVSRLARVPGVDLLLGLIVLCMMFKSKTNWGGDFELTAAGSQARLDKLYAAELRRLHVEGLMLPHAVGRTLARFPMGGLAEAARAFGAKQVPAFAVWGPHDSLCPVEGLEELKEFVPHLRSHLFETAGHAFPLERPEDTTAVLVHFWEGR